jgi:hypothetical protein
METNLAVDITATTPNWLDALGNEKAADHEPNPRPRGEVVVLTNPNTGKPYSQTNVVVARQLKVKPKHESAIRMYACGQVDSIKSAAVLAGTHEVYFSQLLNSPQGQKIVESVKGELDFKYQRLYARFIDVVGDAMNHPEPAVALAGASLFAKTQIGTKHKVELSAEDVVQQIINGTYVRD